ncbi:hypothetical protein Trydic_g8826 [Trypoxylus dichotomus]
MLKIRALNRESSSDEDGPTIRKEAQEEITLDMYNKALRLQSCGELLAAEDILQTLIEDNIPQLESQGGLPKTMSTIKYSCYINLGSIALKKQKLEVALDHYLIASELDKTDVTLWYKIGTIALQLDRFKQASFAFGKGLECNEYHWPCLDKLISVLFALQDTVECLVYIGKALTLDPNYIKGLVLRKNIYECNPATKDYYKLYNPDHVYEPMIDIPVSEEDEIKYLAEAQKLINRVNEMENSLKAKELSWIPLPKPLKEFTWLSVGLTFIELHKYVSDNNLSHFCFVNLNKSMSMNGETRDATLGSETSEKNNNVEDVKCNEAERKDESCDITAENGSQNDKDETPERRLSQTSDINTTFNPVDIENNTPIQTDNDEMEQDIDDTDENVEQRSEKKTPNRGNKRRRDLVSELQIWGWHSKRKYAKKAKIEKDFTIEDALKRIIPNYLLPNGLSEDQLDYPQATILNTILVTGGNKSNLNNSQFENVYFGTEEEKEDVQKFWFQTWECCDVVNLIEGYVYAISKLWKYKWPEALVSVYIEAYNMFREHVGHPKTCDEIVFEIFRNDSLATLLYGELSTFNQIPENKIHPTSLSLLELVSAWNDHWGTDHSWFWCRVHWLRAHVFRKENQNALAIIALQLAQESFTLSETFTELQLPNCVRCNVINESIINALLKNSEMIECLSQLEKLYDSQKYNEVAQVLKLTFAMSNPPTYGRMGRPAQLGMLLHSLWYTDTIECFIWTEECLNECLRHFLKPHKDSEKWEMVVIKCLLFLHDIIKNETVTILDYLCLEKRCRLVRSLALICCQQANSENINKMPLGTVLPWIILHYVLVREEHRQQAKVIVKRIKKDEDKSTKAPESEPISNEHIEEDIPPSIAVLFSGHEFLGNKSWCLTNNGELLHFILDVIIDRLDTPILEPLKEKIDIHLEQAFFCLYQYPSKKNKVSRHLADHNVNPLPLTWERAQQVWDFFCPNALPEFDSYKNVSISFELEQLLQRITSLVPPECDPQPLVPKVMDYVNGISDVLPEPIDFPPKTRSMYYLLGDYHFKQSDVKKSYKYFLLDLCINPLRVDTWACMALGIASQLESKLNHCEKFKTESEFLDKAREVQVCFKQVLSLASDHITLWVEYGSFEYMMHAFCSRVLKSESDTLSMERFELLENKKEEFLNSVAVSFSKALELHEPDQCIVDERWLYHYMLGKIAEKRQKEPAEYLQHYLTAAALLNENNATYPEKISYNSPPHLSIEALELHYRMNTSILKYLELHEGKPIPDVIGKMFKQCLENSVFPKDSEIHKVTEIEIKNTTNEESIKRDIKSVEDTITNFAEEDVKKCVEDVVTQVEKELKEEKSLDIKLSTNDVIMIDDSDEDTTTIKGESEEKGHFDLHSTDVQDIMDAMMKETMKKTQETLMDTDCDVPPQEVVISPDSSIVIKCKEQDIKLETKEERRSEGVKSEKTNDENIRKSTEETTSTSGSSSDSDSSDSDSDESSSSSTSTTSSDNNGNLNDNEVLNLVDQCVASLEQCIRRLPQNYKALYRLAHLYFHYGKKKDLNKCRQLFMGEYKCKNGTLVSGLFGDRKATNFFNGVWRIPSSEIDRPGSLAAHMGRCVSLLLQVLHNTNDHKTLLELCLQLRRTPDADKIYIRHTEREQLSDQAITLCIQCLRRQIKNIDSMSSSAKQRILLDIFRIYQRSQKHLTHKESIFSGMLVDVFKQYDNQVVPETTSALDLAVKYCQQNRAAEKLKKQQTQTLVPRSAPVATTTAPVMPTPATITPAPIQPLKRPGVGRPRGRPPGPKIPGQTKSRTRNPTSSNSLWNKASFEATAYNYIKHFKEELYKQYNETLTITQYMSKFGSFLPTPVNMLRVIQHLASINPPFLDQFSQSTNQLNPNLMNNMGQTNPNLPNNFTDFYNIPTSIPMTSTTTPDIITSDHMKQMSNLTVPTTTFNVTKPTNISRGSNINKSMSTTFKYPTEISKPKIKDITRTTSSYASKESGMLLSMKNSAQKEVEKSTSILKDRPSISITPVTQAMPNIMNPPKPTTSTQPKTLQEKLADKQKQHKNIDKMSQFSSPPSMVDKSPFAPITNNKILDFGTKATDKPIYTSSSTTTFKSTTLSNISIPSSLNVFPTFSKESSYINQAKVPEISLPSNRNEHNLTKVKLPQNVDLPQNLPMALSVIRKPEETRERKSSDDDVIIIE